MSVSPLNAPNSNLNQVLQNYRLFAMNDLRGPASASALLINAEMAKLAAAHLKLTDSYPYNKAILESLQTGKGIPMSLRFKSPAPLPHHIDSKPFMMRADSQSVQTDAILEDQQIACFEIGGEKRLCLPQILKTVLSDFSLDHINQACDKLFIYCSRCNNEQIDLFRKTRNLPPTATTCGLITMTDAERLCMDLLHNSNDTENNYLTPMSDGGRCLKPSESCIPVYHECLGEGTGFFRSELYNLPTAKCIECVDCGRLFSTRHFVGHSHKLQENRVCHWGFDRKKWRSYLLLAEEMIPDDEECAKYELILKDLMGRFSSEQSLDVTESRKRKVEQFETSNEEDDKAKARRFSDSQLQMNRTLPSTWMLTSPPYTFPVTNGDVWPAIRVNGADVNGNSIVSTSSMKSRLAMQASCPPMLENPERVVSSRESNRYEKHFVPNIALQQSNESEQDLTTESEHSSASQHALDKQKNSLLESCLPRIPKPRRFTEPERPVVISVLENLARMENLYMQLLQTTQNLNSDEKESLEQKYVSCSDSIRRHVLPEEPIVRGQSTDG